MLMACSSAPKPQLNSINHNSISYNFETNFISWSSIENANGYTVSILNPLQTFSATTNQYYYPTDKSFSVRIKANATAEFAESDFSNTADIIFLSSPTNLRVINGELIWDAVLNAESYEVYEINSSDSFSTTANKFAGIPSGLSLNYKVRAIGDALRKNNSEYSSPLSFSILTTPSNLRYDRGTSLILWDPIIGASGYTISINDNIFTQGSSNTSYFFSPTETVSVVKVSANSTTTNIFSSAQTVINLRKLTQVATSTIQLTEISTGEVKLSFNPVANALSYKISINGNELQNVSEIGSKVEAYYNFPAGDSLLEIKSIAPISPLQISGVDNYFFDSDTVEFTTNKLSAPTNLRVENGNFIWDSVVNASKYGITYSGSVEFEVSSPSHMFSSDTNSGGNFTAKVRAIGNNGNFISSDFSTELSFSVLPQVNVSTFIFANDILSWQAVQGASSYVVIINDVSTTVNSNSINLQTSSSNSFVIQIIAKGNYAIKVLDAKISNPFTISRLDTPINFQLSVNGILSWSAIPNALRYVINLNNEILYSDVTSYDITNKIGPNQQFVVFVYAESNQSNINPRLNSIPTNSISGRRLSTPSNIRIQGSELKWDPVTNANAYIVTLNGSTNTIAATNEPSFSPNLTNSNPTNTFTVRALANTQAVSNDFFINSPLSTTFSFSSSKLATPLISSIQTVIVENQTYLEITYGSISNASSYLVYVGGIANPTTETTFRFLYSNAGIYDIYVVSVGNGVGSVNSSPSTTRTIKILAATTLSRTFNGSNWILRWNAVNDAQGYRVYKKTTNLTTNQTVLTITNLNNTFTQADVFVEQGFSYEYQIMVLGDGVNTFGSSLSNIIVIS